MRCSSKFRRRYKSPTVFDAPFPRTPANIRIYYISRNSGLHFAADSMGLSSFKYQRYCKFLGSWVKCRCIHFLTSILSRLRLFAYHFFKTVVQTWSAGLAWQHQLCPPWAGYGVTRFFSWALRFACTRPLWCPFCYMLQKPGNYSPATKKKRWRHSTWSANAKSCTYTGLSMS